MNKLNIIHISLLSLLIFSCSTIREEPQFPPSHPLLRIEDKQGKISVILDKDGEFYFLQKDSLIFFTSPAAEPVKAMDADVRRYRSMGKEYELIITIIRNEGPLGLPEYKARIQYKKHDEQEYKESSGTASYTVDQKLHNLWMVKAVDGRAVSTDDFTKEIPVIEMNSSSGTFMGSTSCNSISGSFSTRENILYLGHSRSTRMICEKGEISLRITEILSQGVFEYKFEGRELVFYRRGTEYIRFINVD